MAKADDDADQTSIIIFISFLALLAASYLLLSIAQHTSHKLYLKCMVLIHCHTSTKLSVERIPDS